MGAVYGCEVINYQKMDKIYSNNELLFSYLEKAIYLFDSDTIKGHFFICEQVLSSLHFCYVWTMFVYKLDKIMKKKLGMYLMHLCFTLFSILYLRYHTFMV